MHLTLAKIFNLSKQKEVYTCECGETVIIARRTEHNKSIKHSTFSTFSTF